MGLMKGWSFAKTVGRYDVFLYVIFLVFNNRVKGVFKRGMPTVTGQQELLSAYLS